MFECPAWTYDVLTILDYLFTAVFALELILKIVVLRITFLFSKWNLIDLIVVIVGLVAIGDQAAVGMNPLMMRLIRLVKLTRCLRMLRVAIALDTLKLIL